MRTIRISEEVWNAIAERGKFGESEDDVLRRVFNIDSQHLQNDRDKNAYTIQQLLNMNLNNSKPKILYIDERNFPVDFWVQVCTNFVEFLISNKLISKTQLPIFAYSKRGKYFINDKAEHSRTNLDGDWKQVAEFFVDIKYNSINHIKNIATTLDQLNIGYLNIKINIDLSSSAQS